MNQYFCRGNLTRDVELKDINNSDLATFGMAINEFYKNKKTGEKEKITTFLDVECWGPRAKTLSEYTKKGSTLTVRGTLRMDNWEDKEGNKRSKLKVRLEDFWLESKKSMGDMIEKTQDEEPEVAKTTPF